MLFICISISCAPHPFQPNPGRRRRARRACSARLLALGLCTNKLQYYQLEGERESESAPRHPRHLAQGAADAARHANNSDNDAMQRHGSTLHTNVVLQSHRRRGCRCWRQLRQQRQQQRRVFETKCAFIIWYAHPQAQALLLLLLLLVVFISLFAVGLLVN